MGVKVVGVRKKITTSGDVRKTFVLNISTLGWKQILHVLYVAARRVLLIRKQEGRGRRQTRRRRGDGAARTGRTGDHDEPEFHSVIYTQATQATEAVDAPRAPTEAVDAPRAPTEAPE